MSARTDADRVAELKELLSEVQYRLWYYADCASGGEVVDDLVGGLAFGATVQRLVEDALSVIRRDQRALELAAVARA